jgi:hypothetical protein
MLHSLCDIVDMMLDFRLIVVHDKLIFWNIEWRGFKANKFSLKTVLGSLWLTKAWLRCVVNVESLESVLHLLFPSKNLSVVRNRRLLGG